MTLPENPPLTLTAAAAALRAGTTTSRALTEEAIDVADRLDEQVGTYLHRFDDLALAAADRADAELAAGQDRGPLHGIPFGVKDIIAMAEGPTTAQSLVLDRTWGAGKDAPVVTRLKAAGAVITGKTTTMEFACGMPDPGKPFPIPRNPWDVETWPGGSSSGTGSGVAAGMFLAGLGTDTAGSIRIPSALCGITGLMPTFGRVPKSGCVPLGYSLDHIGPMARSAADCAAVLEVIAGLHASDPDCVDAPFAASSLNPTDVTDLAGLRIGVVRAGHFPDGADPALADVFDAAVAQLGALGADPVEVELPFLTQMLTADIVTMACEALAYHRTDMTHRWDDYFVATRVMLAQGALVSGADYVQAQRMRRAAQLALGRLFEQIDVVVCPTISVGAPPLAGFLDGTDDVMALFSFIHTGYWDSVGNPVLALPMGETAAGMPLSLQIAGRPFEEATILRAGAAFQGRTDHHLRVPGLALAGAQLAA
jgi:aspartyl-tRNA(Asn)/glutamyl-tRNA(Gln) amidotransferase subunit A